jgi:hypothetical protein
VVAGTVIFTPSVHGSACTTTTTSSVQSRSSNSGRNAGKEKDKDILLRLLPIAVVLDGALLIMVVNGTERNGRWSGKSLCVVDRCDRGSFLCVCVLEALIFSSHNPID